MSESSNVPSAAAVDLKRVVRWTVELPTEPGWYWMQEGYDEPHIFRIGSSPNIGLYLDFPLTGPLPLSKLSKSFTTTFGGPIPLPGSPSNNY